MSNDLSFASAKETINHIYKQFSLCSSHNCLWHKRCFNDLDTDECQFTRNPTASHSAILLGNVIQSYRALCSPNSRCLLNHRTVRLRSTGLIGCSKALPAVPSFDHLSSQKSMLVLLLHASLAWWAHPHQLIAAIAETYLSRSELETLRKLMGGNGLPAASMPEVASWQDDLKDLCHIKAMGGWHFSNRAYVDPAWENPTPELKPVVFNIGDVSKSLWRALQDPTTTSLWAIQFCLRSLVHFVGDVHTPHHVVEFYSKAIPRGDDGGTKYFMNCNYGSTCLHIHFIWDAAGLAYQMGNPIAGATRAAFDKNVSAIMREHPAEKYEELDVVDFDKWMDESYEVAKAHGYSVPMRSWPSHEYMATVHAESKKRIALAGYRLGMMMKNLLQNRKFDVEGTRHNASEWVAWALDAVLFVCLVAGSVLKVKKGLATRAEMDVME